MKTLVGAIIAALFLVSPTSAEEIRGTQVGIVCNNSDAAAAFVFAQSFLLTYQSNLEAAARSVSSPRKWCIVGMVRGSRSNVQTDGLEESIAAAQLMRIGIQAISVMPVMSSVLDVLFSTGSDATAFELRKFRRENGYTGFYLVVKAE